MRQQQQRWRFAGGGLKVLALCVGAVTLTGTLAGCSYFSSSAKSTIENPDPPTKLYNQADALMNGGKYEMAAKKFEEVDRQHPYSPFARRAIVMSGYSYFKARKFAEAVVASRRYVTLHPGTKEAALAHHIIAMSYFDQIHDPARDQTKTKKALTELKTLVRRYPNSRYSRQALNRIRIAKDVLAAAEMNVGRYYLRRQNYLAAINRFRTVVTDYQTTAHVEEALMRLTETYMALGIKHEAQTAAAVLGHNFPNSKWYKDAYVLLASDGLAPRADTGSWLTRALSGTIKSVNSLNPF